MMANNSNGSFFPSMDFDDNKCATIAKTIAYCFLFLVSIVGNSLVVWIIYKDQRLKTTTNFLVANMAVSDLLSTLFYVPAKTKKIYFGKTWLLSGDFGLAFCKLIPFVHDVSITVSMYSCIFIAIDRFYAVTHSSIVRGSFSRYRLKYIIPGIWIYSCLIISPNLYFFRIFRRNHQKYCSVPFSFYSQHKIHGFIVLALLTCIPIPVITTLYIIIVYKLHQHQTPGNRTEMTRKRSEQNNRRVLLMSLTIVSLLCVSWLFFSIIQILYVVGLLSTLNPVQFSNVIFVGEFLLSMTFIYNFFIYVTFNAIYRENVKAIIKKWCCRRCCRENQPNDAIISLSFGYSKTGHAGNQLSSV